MDKKNTVIGLLLLGVAFFLFSWQARQHQEFEEARRAEQLHQQQQEQEEQERAFDRRDLIPEAESPPEAPRAPTPGPDFLTDVPAGIPEVATPRPEETDSGAREHFVLENEYIRVTFTNLGGAIERVEFLQTAPDGEVDPFIFNEGDTLPSHTLEFPDGRGRLVPFLPVFEAAEVDAERHRLVFRYRDPQGLVFERTYRLVEPGSAKDPYTILHHLRVVNDSGAPRALPTTYLRMGTTRSLGYTRMNVGEFLNVGHYDGRRIRYIRGRQFIGRQGFLGIGQRLPIPDFRQEASLENVRWTNIKNQFFVGILREVPGDGMPYRARRLVAEARRTDRQENQDEWKNLGISGSVGYELGSVSAGEVLELGTEFFIGPKEFMRLQRMGDSEERLMQYWGPDIIAQALTVVMYGIHFLFPSWGVAIIILVLIIKLVFWPLTSKGMRAQKMNAVKMAPLQDDVRKLNEKYKTNSPAKQKAMMELYRKHDVNPAAMLTGCFPMLIQIPVFIGLYAMLRVSPEFRYSSLLWVEQLAFPDTLATIGGFPINLLPLIYGIVMYLQMRMTPMPETMDDSQRMMFKMMRMLPLFLVIILYNFAAALFVYFTTNSLLTMLQQYLINRKLKPEIEALKAEVERKTKAMEGRDGETPSPTAGPAPWEKGKSKDKKAAPKRPAMDGLGSTRRLKGDGSSRSRTRRRRKK